MERITEGKRVGIEKTENWIKSQSRGCKGQKICGIKRKIIKKPRNYIEYVAEENTRIKKM
jgi:hypothetical protein